MAVRQIFQQFHLTVFLQPFYNKPTDHIINDRKYRHAHQNTCKSKKSLEKRN